MEVCDVIEKCVSCCDKVCVSCVHAVLRLCGQLVASRLVPVRPTAGLGLLISKKNSQIDKSKPKCTLGPDQWIEMRKA